MTSIQLQQLYDRDFAQWIAATIAHLKDQNVSALDWENLIEEMEGLGKSERRELENRLEVLLAHILKRCYVAIPDYYRGWQATIQTQRNALRRLLTQSPNLKPYLSELFDVIADDALLVVRAGYPDALLPSAWPFSRDLGALLDTNFWQ